MALGFLLLVFALGVFVFAASGFDIETVLDELGRAAEVIADGARSLWFEISKELP